MSYHRKQPIVIPAWAVRKAAQGGAEIVALGDAVGVIQTAVDVTKDPYFSETVCRVQQLAAIENRRAVPACAQTQSNLTGGVGLRKVMPALRAYVKAEQKPWLYAVGAGVVIGLPMLIGYALGKGR